MALAITEATPELLDTSNTTSYSMTAFTPAANSLILVFVWAQLTVSSAGVLSGGSLTWNNLIIGDTAQASYYCFYAQAGASPASCTINFSCTADASTGCMMVAYQITGHNQSVPFAQSKTQSWATLNPVITLDQAMNTNNGYCCAVVIGRTAPASTPPASWTEVVDGGIATPAIGVTSAYRVNGETGTTVTFTMSGNADIQILFAEINETSQGAVTIKRLSLLGVG